MSNKKKTKVVNLPQGNRGEKTPEQAPVNAQEAMFKSVSIESMQSMAKNYKKGSYLVLGETVLVTIDKVVNKSLDNAGNQLELPNTVMDALSKVLRNDACIVDLSKETAEKYPDIKPGCIVGLNKPPHYQPPMIKIDGQNYYQFDARMIMGILTDKQSKNPTSTLLKPQESTPVINIGEKGKKASQEVEDLVGEAELD